MIKAAKNGIGSNSNYTPLLSSKFLDKISGKKIYVKAECLQKTGSFKFRGGWSFLSNLTEKERRSGVLAFSSGNHAQGVSAAAKAFSVPCTIVMPKDAPKIKIKNTIGYGAHVVLYDRKKDPYELNNVYENDEYKSIREDLHLRLESLRVKYQDSDELNDFYINKYLEKNKSRN